MFLLKKKKEKVKNGKKKCDFNFNILHFESETPVGIFPKSSGSVSHVHHLKLQSDFSSLLTGPTGHFNIE